MAREDTEHRLGWLGTGRMGSALVRRLLAGGCDVAVYNRTKAKAEPLAALGATVVDSAAELADRDIVFATVGRPRLRDGWTIVAPSMRKKATRSCEMCSGIVNVRR